MKVIKTEFEGLLIIEPTVFKDNRGYFYEAYNKKAFLDAGIDFNFIQDNQSLSKRGVLRGLHFQRPPFEQTKLIRVLSGIILDVVVDLRRDKSTFGRVFSIELSSGNHLQLLQPKGFAHGFVVISEFAEVLYKTDEYHHPEAEGGLIYDDPTFQIDWKIKREDMILSERDKTHPRLDQLDLHSLT